MLSIRWTIAGAAVFGLCAFTSVAAAAAGHGHGPINGVVPSKESHAAKTASTSNPLIYNGGPVLNDGNTVYAIFWSPGNRYSFEAGYQGLLERFYTDVAAATGAGATTNVYAVDSQYGPTSQGGTIGTPFTSNAETFGGFLVDNTSVKSGCRDHYTSICVSDSQVVSEINRDMNATGWSNGLPTAAPNHIFFVFTAKGVGSCYSSGSCSFSQWCAYHSNYGSSLLYANMPYADTVPAACDAGYHPNSNDADATINVTSHEHNETITDPFGSAWYDSSGNEIGDKCAWNFGTVGSNQANQSINGHSYILQQEWSNSAPGCVLQG